MPYIKQDRRSHLLPKLLQIVPLTEGELNYCLTTIVMEFYQDIGPGYPAINTVLGALEGAKLEFYRRVAAPYEDDAKSRNGDVYPHPTEMPGPQS